MSTPNTTHENINTYPDDFEDELITVKVQSIRGRSEEEWNEIITGTPIAPKPKG